MSVEKKAVGRPEKSKSEKKELIHYGLESGKVERLGGKKKVQELSIQLINRYYEKSFKNV